MIPDNSIFAARREALCDILKKQNIQSANVLEAIKRVPRHLFMDDTLIAFAYENKAFPIGCGQTISQPYTVALQTQLLDIKPNDKILEVGTGSGYQTAVLVEMGANVYTIERQQSLYNITVERLNSLGYKAACYCGDGYEGLVNEQPFDKIIVTAGAPELPTKLIKQLKVGGRIVIPMGVDNMNIYCITRVTDTNFKQERISRCEFVPMLKGLDDRPL